MTNFYRDYASSELVLEKWFELMSSYNINGQWYKICKNR